MLSRHGRGDLMIFQPPASKLTAKTRWRGGSLTTPLAICYEELTITERSIIRLLLVGLCTFCGGRR